MAIHKIQIDDFFSVDDYVLLAIHSSLEDYRLAYMLNQTLEIQLKKNKKNLEINSKNDKSTFNLFTFEDEKQDVTWNLIENKSANVDALNSEYGIFDAIAKTVYMVPEFKKAEFLLKIENTEEEFCLESLSKKIQEIKQISTFYKIDHNKLKSRNNLIF